MRRGFIIAFWGVVLTMIGRATLLPSVVRNARVSGLSGTGPSYATFSWSYGPGARPQSIIFDLDLAGMAASITTDGEATEAEVPFRATRGGPYQLRATATYRILGSARTAAYQFAGQI